jgi:diguanylate cyclase (GGDEF)-like protein/PAS domain S-box-containing protein
MSSNNKKGSSKALDTVEASSVLDSIAIPTFAINDQHEITHWNQAIAKASGYPAEEMIGTKNQWKPFYSTPRPTMSDLIVDGGKDDAIKTFYSNKYQKSSVLDSAYEAEDFFPAMGNGEWLSFTAAPIFDADKNITGAVETLIVISDRKHAEKNLLDSQHKYRELSTIDDLTQLLNSRQFFSNIKDEVDRSNRYRQAQSICMFDLDHFKDVNDTYGHQFGNTVLESFAKIIKTNIRDVDMAYRYGGEEFVVIFPFVTAEQSITVVERIRQELEGTSFMTPQGETVKLTVSAGLATHRSLENQEEYLRRADQAMYESKENGRNKITIAK